MYTVYQEHTLVVPQYGGYHLQADLSGLNFLCRGTHNVSAFFLYVSSTGCGDEPMCPLSNIVLTKLIVNTDF